MEEIVKKMKRVSMGIVVLVILLISVVSFLVITIF